MSLKFYKKSEDYEYNIETNQIDLDEFGTCVYISRTVGESEPIRAYLLNPRNLSESVQVKEINYGVWAFGIEKEALIATGKIKEWFGDTSSYKAMTFKVIPVYISANAETGTVDVKLTLNHIPSTPYTITLPSTVYGGKSCSVSWSKSTDEDGNLEGYIVERSYNGGSSW